MFNPKAELGTVQALLDRLVKYRLPRLSDIKQRVDAGEKLSETDIDFLRSSLQDAQETSRHIVRHPELQALGSRVSALYAEIIKTATENETRG
ncbi:hypothetical protein DWG18_05320 [Lysobacter sp. TY2-98]|uniref:hypothetical protein n=1 Tax=Lysobacter sp. TY2-98 TaxID=2290922 RepID=UPI000E1FE404|nr:hypothetical protein [Lysobacter sp. TY2-98]AXK71765.1 hypothetical protein DWG18_05320 [Lysobacter sp. TY2-98]